MRITDPEFLSLFVEALIQKYREPLSPEQRTAMLNGLVKSAAELGLDVPAFRCSAEGACLAEERRVPLKESLLLGSQATEIP